MGQLVTVREKPSSNPGVVRFEINRSLTGMGHERYSSLDDIVRNRPVDAIARRLFEHGGVDTIHVNSSVITVHLAGGSRGEGMLEVIEKLFKFYDEPENGTVESEPATDVVDESTEAAEPTEAEPDAPAEDTSSDEATASTEETAPESVAGEPEAVEAEEPAAAEPVTEPGGEVADEPAADQTATADEGADDDAEPTAD